MTEEELFKVYIKRELCAHCRFPQLCKGDVYYQSGDIELGFSDREDE